MEGKSIKESLSEMKDLAVLAIDLAYCSLFFDNKEIAREVKKIAEKMDSLRDETEKMVLRASKSEDEDKLVGLLRTSAYTERISDVAAQIADVVLDGKIHEIEKESFKDSNQNFKMIRVDKEFEGRKIAEIGDIKNIWIIAIKRKDKWSYHPSGKVSVSKGDVLIGTSPQGYEKA